MGPYRSSKMMIPMTRKNALRCIVASAILHHVQAFFVRLPRELSKGGRGSCSICGTVSYSKVALDAAHKSAGIRCDGVWSLDGWLIEFKRSTDGPEKTYVSTKNYDYKLTELPDGAGWQLNLGPERWTTTVRATHQIKITSWTKQT